MFTYCHAIMPLGQSECTYYLSYFVKLFIKLMFISHVVVFIGSYFIKAIENLFPVFAKPDMNTQRVRRI